MGVLVSKEYSCIKEKVGDVRRFPTLSKIYNILWINCGNMNLWNLH